MPTTVKARDKDYVKLQKYSKKHGVSITEALSKAVSTMKVKKLESKDLDSVFEECEECGCPVVPKGANFCPGCGVEFETDEEEEEDEIESDEETEE